MTARITDDEWDKLSPENFETHSLLRAVDAVDELRDDLNDGAYATPPQLRTDLLKLRQLAMAVINEGSRSQMADLFELASDLDEQVSYMMIKLKEVQDTLYMQHAFCWQLSCNGIFGGSGLHPLLLALEQSDLLSNDGLLFFQGITSGHCETSKLFEVMAIADVCVEEPVLVRIVSGGLHCG